MKKQYDVIAVGMINFDINVKNFSPEKMDRKVQGVEQIALGFGGDAQNSASTMARLGLKTAICGAVGRDIAGDLCLANEQRVGLDTSFVCRKDVQTGTAIQLFQTAEAHVLDCCGANRVFKESDIPEAVYGASKIVSLHSFFNCGEIGAGFLKKVQACGAITVADTTTPPRGSTLDEIREALAYIDYFLPSYPEASELTNLRDPEEICARLSECGAKNIVLKMGDQGCYLKTADFAGIVNGYTVSSVVDTTGCGDNFVAGFIGGLAKGLPAVECAHLANAAGAINATRLGSNGAVQSFDQLMDFISEQKARGYAV